MSMLKTVLCLTAVVAVLSIPVRITERYTLPDNTFEKVYSTSNPTYASGLFVSSNEGKLGYFAAGSSALTNLNNLGNPINAVAVHPTKNFIYVAYSRSPSTDELASNRIQDGSTSKPPTKIAVVSEYQLSLTSANTERILMTIPTYTSGNEALISDLIFGPDGNLWAGVANGLWRNSAGRKDPQLIAQSRDNVHGKIIRVDINAASSKDGLPYSIPSGNPWSNIAGVRNEVFATGFANPKRLFLANSKLYVLDENDDGIQDELNEVVRGADYGFNAIVNDGTCYINPNCTATPGQKPARNLQLLKSSSIGAAVYSDKIYYGSGQELLWVSTNFSNSGDVTILDNEGYAAATRYPELSLTDVQVHSRNGTMFVIGSGQAKRSIIFAVIEDVNAAVTSYRVMSFVLLISLIVAMIL